MYSSAARVVPHSPEFMINLRNVMPYGSYDLFMCFHSPTAVPPVTARSYTALDLSGASPQSTISGYLLDCWWGSGHGDRHLVNAFLSDAGLQPADPMAIRSDQITLASLALGHPGFGLRSGWSSRPGLGPICILNGGALALGAGHKPHALPGHVCLF